jgi:hypothetical protein
MTYRLVLYLQDEPEHHIIEDVPCTTTLEAAVYRAQRICKSLPSIWRVALLDLSKFGSPSMFSQSGEL